MQNHPVIFWFRSDLRLSDNPALIAACETGKTVIPVYILDDDAPGIWKRGGASRWWLHHSLDSLSASLETAGFHPLVLEKGGSLKALEKIIKETGADAVYWNRCYEPYAIQRDTEIKKKLTEKKIEAASFNGSLMFEPWTIKNKTGGDYKVFTPFSKACLEQPIRPAITKKPKPVFDKKHIKGLALKDLDLLPKIKWAETIAKTWIPGEATAQKELKSFVKNSITAYKTDRDYPAVIGTSRLSPHLHFGEISPWQCWHAAAAGHTPYPWQRQLLWREFSYHLLYYAPDFPEKPWNERFAKFKWAKNAKHLKAWQTGMTGYPIVDAGMRELWQTGWMHNRVRMIVGSFLVKNLLQNWRDGEDWFWDTLVDADLGNNAAGWQWIAGCGADAAPYFRIFNPVTQSEKFDAAGKYIRKYIPELANIPDEYLHAPWEAPPIVRALAKDYPEPIVDLAASRARALEAYADTKTL